MTVAAIHHRQILPTHAVRVRLPRTGWTLQACRTAAEASEIFDAIRELRPFLELQRLCGDKVVELSGQGA